MMVVVRDKSFLLRFIKGVNLKKRMMTCKMIINMIITIKKAVKNNKKRIDLSHLMI